MAHADEDFLRLESLYRKKSCPEYEGLLAAVVSEFRDAFSDLSVAFEIKSRVKSFEGWWKKYRDLQSGGEREIVDMLGIRVIVPFLEDLDAVEACLLEHFEIIEVDRKGKRYSIHEFGYDSIHLQLRLTEKKVLHPLPLTLPVCEIQLRTILQEAWAEVEHELIYKSEWSIPTGGIRRKLAALNANLSLSDIIFQELREFQKEVHVKQEKRRSIQESRLAILRDGQARKILRKEGLGRAHPELQNRQDTLEKLLLKALNAHSEEHFEEAVHLYGEAIGLSSTDHFLAILYNHRGMAYFALGENNAALVDFRKSVQLDAENYRSWTNLGQAMTLRGDDEGALDAFAVAVRLEPAVLTPFTLRARLLAVLGRKDEAREEISVLLAREVHVDELHALEKELNF